ncbi:hypothetical protein D9M69_561850 [compost metagenome]
MGAVPGGNVGAVGDRLATLSLDGGDHFLGRAEAAAFTALVATQIVDHHAGAFTGGQFGDLRPNTTACASDDHHFPFKQICHLNHPYLSVHLRKPCPAEHCPAKAGKLRCARR